MLSMFINRNWEKINWKHTESQLRHWVKVPKIKNNILDISLLAEKLAEEGVESPSVENVKNSSWQAASLLK